MSLLRVGILADDRLQQHMLNDCLQQQGIAVVVNSDPSRFELLNRTALELDVWIATVTENEADQDMPPWLLELLDGDVPVLMVFDKAPIKGCVEHLRWQTGLIIKLRELVGLAKQPSDSLPGSSVHASNAGSLELWVLGASLGGPAAVSEFLDALPAGLPVAFVYAQHIDYRFQDTLQKTVGRRSDYQLRNLLPVGKLKAGEVLVAPVAEGFYFDDAERPVSSNRAWDGHYAPNISQVMLNTYQCFGQKTGFILFSGMGDDGTDAINRLADAGVPVWVQTPDSCANASMVEAAIETQQVSFVGTPTELARQLVNHLTEQGNLFNEPTSGTS